MTSGIFPRFCDSATPMGLSWGSFYAFLLHFHFESLHVRTDRKINANTNAWLMQMQTTRHFYNSIELIR